MQIEIPWWRTTFGDSEVAAITYAIRSERISQGKVTDELESRLCEALGVSHVLVTTSGSVSLLLAMMAVGITKGDEVLVPDRTWVATAHAALMLGATVTLVDTRSDYPLMDVEAAEALITKRTRAIVPVHLNGRSTGMAGVCALAKKYNLMVIEDACQAMFSKDSLGYLGTIGDLGCFSLGVTKLISTGQGGFVVTNNDSLYEKLRLLRNHGVVDNFTDRWNQLGFNFKFTDIQAAMGIAQLERVPHRLKHVRAVYSAYQEQLKDLQSVALLGYANPGSELPLYIDVTSDRRDALITYLLENGIQPRPYPPSLHTCNYMPQRVSYPNSNHFSKIGMFLPCGPELPLPWVEKTCDAIRKFERNG